jgi:hypothetical protein
MTMEDTPSQEFHVSLPSNASYEVFPDNTNGHYKTHLSRRLKLSASDWIVGLTEMHYTNSWHNIDIGEIVWTEPVLADDGSDADADNLLTVPTRGDLAGLAYLPRVDGDRTVYDTETKKTVSKGRYLYLRELVAALIGATRSTPLNGKLLILYDQYADRVKVSLVGSTRARLRFSADINQILGFADDAVFTSPGATASRGPDMERGLTALYVYADVVGNRLVGDALAPLLRVVPVKGDRFQNVHVEFTNIQYLPVANFVGREVEVKVARDTGQTVSFTTGKVIANLHFKRVARE